MSNWMNTVDGNGEGDEEENEIVVDESDKSESDVEEEIEEEVGTEDESDDFEPTTSDEIAESTEQEEEQIQKDAEAVESEPEESGPQVISADGGGDETEDAEEETDGNGETETEGDEITLAEVAPDADKTMDEAQNEDYRWQMMVWGNPGCGKSHLSYTFDKPIVFIDTEGKGSNIAHKFENTENIVFYTPEDYDEAVDALHSGIEALDAMKKKTGQVGTIVVDSMSVMWGWAKQKYVDVYYPGKDEEEVNFQSGLQGGDDWKMIKKLHNSDFRKVMTDSDYNLCWTAMREDDYEQVFEDDGGNETGDKPSGEKENPFKVDQIIRLRKNNQGEPVGTLQKTGFIRHGYTGLKYPTFDKHRDVVEAISEAEEGVDPERSINPDLPHGAEITEKTRY